MRLWLYALLKFNTRSMVIEIRQSLLRQDLVREVSNLIFEASNHARYDIFVDMDGETWKETGAILHSEDRLVLEKGFKKWLTQRKSDIVVTLEPVGDEFGIDEALKYLKQPFKILLENSDNDAFFLDALLKHFRKKGRKISRFRENLFLEYANAGGKTNVAHYIQGELGKYRALPKAPERYLRLFVLVDSDSEHKGEEKPAITSLRTYLESLGVPYHILTKREMENYLPDAVIQTVEGGRDFIQAYLRLQPEQKDYFDLEKGFPDQNRRQVEQDKGAAFQMLYHSVSDADWQVFRGQKFGLSDFKNALPRFFEAEQVTQETLQARVAHQDNPDELKDILDAITRCL